MKTSGSFRLALLDYKLNPAIKEAPKAAVNFMAYLHLSGLQEYLIDVAKRIPVLTGATRGAVVEVLEEIELKLDNAAAKIGLPFVTARISMEPTKRQYPGSADYPASPDTTPPYGGIYSPQHYELIGSRQQWREAAEGNTRAFPTRSFAMDLSAGGQLIFNMSIATDDQGFDYWADGEPASYRPEERKPELYEQAVRNAFEMYVTRFLRVFAPEGNGQAQFSFMGEG